MDGQRNLFDVLEVPRNEREARFLQFHKQNPIVYELWDRFTRQAIERGYERIGSQMIMERIRWETSVAIKDARPDGETVKLNDHHKPYYARLWMRNNPAYKNIFSTRKVTGDVS